MHWFIGGDFQTRLYGLPVERARRSARTESFPTETKLKLNAQTRVEAAGGERLSQMFVRYGVAKLSGQQVRGGKREAGMSAGPLLIVYFGAVSLNTPERLLFLSDDL